MSKIDEKTFARIQARAKELAAQAPARSAEHKRALAVFINRANQSALSADQTARHAERLAAP